MQPGKFTIKFYRATTLNYAFVYKVDGVTQPFTGASAIMQVRSGPDSSTVVATFTTADGSIVLNETVGRIRIHMSATNTALLPVGEYVYDLNVTESDGTVTKLLRGAFVVLDPVTE